MFRACWQRKRNQDFKLNESKKKICIECGEMKIHVGNKMCSKSILIFRILLLFLNLRNCYMRKRKQALKLDESKKKVCIECGEVKLIEARGMCQ